MHARTWAAVMLLLAGGAPALAASAEDGVAAMQAGDYAAARAIAEPLAATGNAGAQFLLGLIYAKGRGVPVDAAAAAEWYRKAALQGLPEAENNLGSLYANGEGVPHSHPEALKWWLLAADQGLSLAQLNASRMIADGDDVPQDYVQAFKWASLAADAGESEARDILARIRPEMTAEDVAAGERMAKGWRPVQRT